MSGNKQILSGEQLDFLKEMMNIGAGNACTAFQKILQHPVDLVIPKVYILPTPRIPSVFNSPSLPVACVKMGMVGDVDGSIFYILPEKHRETLLGLVERATPGFIRLNNMKKRQDISVF